MDGEAGTRELKQRLLGELGGVGEKLGVERGVVPPIGGDFADRTGHAFRLPVGATPASPSFSLARRATQASPLQMLRTAPHLNIVASTSSCGYGWPRCWMKPSAYC